MKWTVTLLAGWLALYGASHANAVLPTSWWFEVGEVKVYDSESGYCPRMDFSRDIHGDFFAEWTVTIMRRGVNGFVTYRTYQGANDYSPDATLPDDLNLCWWTWGDDLLLSAGEYRIRTLWTITPPHTNTRQIRRTSNIFEVTG